MIIRNTKSLGQLIRDRRLRRGWSQAQLGEQVGASRYWVADIERGKPSAEVGLVLGALEALGLAVDVRTAGATVSAASAGTPGPVERHVAEHGRTPLSRGGKPLRVGRGADGREGGK